ncbi:hypothetical protein PHMEG_0008263 [Phytophthora megakarya]|uniref:Uncharacterized protein n=1 Tax=Phytophthora megakarya TaxID=4795 RepID=A0A225WJ58_9STRA|nr:hypothetical protein PHMEG_0008263 [Phytophthora megakarya]
MNLISLSRGPRKLKHYRQALGLLLADYVGWMGQKDLCTTFGVPYATVSRMLTAAEDSMQVALKAFSPARFVLPTLDATGIERTNTCTSWDDGVNISGGVG